MDDSLNQFADRAKTETEKSTPRLDIGIAKSFIKTLLPPFDEFIRHIEKDKGWVRLPSEMVAVAVYLNISKWPEVFLSEDRFRSLQWRTMSLLPTDMLTAFFSDGSEPCEPLKNLDFSTLPTATSDERTVAMLAELNKASVDQQSALLNAFFKNMTDAVGVTDEAIGEAVESELCNTKPSDAKDSGSELDPDDIRKMQIACLAFVTALFNYLALVVHGQKMTELVQRAISGDDKAFLMAVQVDKTLLTHLPQFANRYWVAVIGGEEDFLEHLAYRMMNPTLRARKSYPTLWFLLVMLDDLGFLGKGITNEEILDLYKSIPEEHVCKPIDDVDYVRKQRAAYMRLKRQTK